MNKTSTMSREPPRSTSITSVANQNQDNLMPNNNINQHVPQAPIGNNFVNNLSRYTAFPQSNLAMQQQNAMAALGYNFGNQNMPALNSDPQMINARIAFDNTAALNFNQNNLNLNDNNALGGNFMNMQNFNNINQPALNFNYGNNLQNAAMSNYRLYNNAHLQQQMQQRQLNQQLMQEQQLLQQQQLMQQQMQQPVAKDASLNSLEKFFKDVVTNAPNIINKPLDSIPSALLGGGDSNENQNVTHDNISAEQIFESTDDANGTKDMSEMIANANLTEDMSHYLQNVLREIIVIQNVEKKEGIAKNIELNLINEANDIIPEVSAKTGAITDIAKENSSDHVNIMNDNEVTNTLNNFVPSNIDNNTSLNPVIKETVSPSVVGRNLYYSSDEFNIEGVQKFRSQQSSPCYTKGNKKVYAIGSGLPANKFNNNENISSTVRSLNFDNNTPLPNVMPSLFGNKNSTSNSSIPNLMATSQRDEKVKHGLNGIDIVNRLFSSNVARSVPDNLDTQSAATNEIKHLKGKELLAAILNSNETHSLDKNFNDSMDTAISSNTIQDECQESEEELKNFDDFESNGSNVESVHDEEKEPLQDSANISGFWETNVGETVTASSNVESIPELENLDAQSTQSDSPLSFWDAEEFRSESRANSHAERSSTRNEEAWERPVSVASNGTSLVDFPALKAPSFSAIAAKKTVALPVVTTTTKKVFKHESFYVVVTVAGRRYIIPSDYHNMLIHQLNHWYCMGCLETMTQEGRDIHKAGERHRQRMSECPLLDRYGEDMIRRLDKKYIHCAACNILTLEHQLGNHCRLEDHKRTVAKIISMSTLNQVNKQQETDKIVQRYLATLSGLKEDSFIMMPAPLPDNVIVHAFGVDLKITTLGYHGIIGYEDCFRCVICFWVLQKPMLRGHFEQNFHAVNLAKRPFVKAQKLNLIRTLNNKSVHCAICNIMVENRAEAIDTHTATTNHRTRMQKAVGGGSEAGLLRIDADAPSVPQPMVAKPEPAPPAVSSPRAAAAHIPSVAPLRPPEPKKQPKPPPPPKLPAIAHEDFSATLNTGRHPYLIHRGCHRILIGADAWHGLRADRASVHCHLCRLNASDKEQHRNSTMHNAQLMAVGFIESEEHFIREISPKQCHCLVCNAPVSRASVPAHIQDAWHAARAARAAEAARHPPEDAEVIRLDEQDDEDQDAIFQKSYLIEGPVTVLVSWLAWNGLTAAGRSYRCLPCHAAVEVPIEHGCADEHTDSLNKCRLLDMPPHAIRKLNLKSYQCITCNTVIQVPQLDNHIKKSTHTKALSDAQENAKNPTANATTVVNFNDYVVKEQIDAAKHHKKKDEKVVQETAKVETGAVKLTKKIKKEKKKEAKALKAKTVESLVEIRERRKPRTKHASVRTDDENQDDLKDNKNKQDDEEKKSDVKDISDVKDNKSDTNDNKTGLNDNKSELESDKIQIDVEECDNTKKEEIVEQNKDDIPDELTEKPIDSTIRYKLYFLKPFINSDLQGKYDCPKKVLILEKEDTKTCISCGSNFDTSVEEHASTEDHMMKTSARLSEFKVEVPEIIKKRGFAEPENDNDSSMCFIQAVDNSHSMVLLSTVWNGIIYGEKIRCFVCAVDVSESKIEKHTQKKEHVGKLKSVVSSNDGSIIRAIGESTHCLTCNIIIPNSDQSNHLKDEKHNQLLKKALESTKMANLKITQIICLSDYTIGSTKEQKDIVKEFDEKSKIEFLAALDIGRMDYRCLPCGECVPKVLTLKHVRGKKHSAAVAYGLERSLMNPKMSTVILKPKRIDAKSGM